MQYWAWLWLMAWRDSRRQLKRLFLFIASIVLGIAALVAINSFGDNLLKDIDFQAKELLGADLVLTSGQPLSPTLQNIIDTLQAEAKASEINFASMAYFPKSKSTRLVQVRCLEGDFPFYGKLEVENNTAYLSFQNQAQALVEMSLMAQFNAKIGDSVQLGKRNFGIIAKLTKAPGQTGIGASVASPIYISKKFAESTGLLQKGSRINYIFYFKITDSNRLKIIIAKLKPIIEKNNIRYETVEIRKQNISTIFKDITQFFNLVGFIALLLGVIGISSSVNIYIKEKIKTIAILRCLGVSSQQAFLIFLLQIFSMGFIGSLLGVGLGVMIQAYFPILFERFLPFVPSTAVSLQAIVQGLFMGLGLSMLFALIPLMSIRKISPLLTLRSDIEENWSSFTWIDWLIHSGIYTLILCVLLFFSYQQIQNLRNTIYFVVFTTFCVGVLYYTAKGLMRGIRRFFPTHWSFLFRQALANLYRPNNQTIILLTTIGLGTGFISTLYLLQELLLGQIALTEATNQPNLILFDIQQKQKQEVATFMRQNQVPILQEVPIVTMQIEALRGRKRTDWLNDTTPPNRLSKNSLTREYRSTYRATLNASERIIEGKWQGKVGMDRKIYVSLEEFQARQLKAKIGDKIVFNVQGANIETYVGSIRKVRFSRVEPVFAVVFPEGVLEEAPQFFVFVSKVKNYKESAKIQREIVQKYPNIAIVDLLFILQTTQNILQQVSFVIQFMAMFSILTGIVVLIGSVMLSRFQRIKESVLLRTLGASHKQILSIFVLEYLFLGSLSTLAGIFLSVLSTWLLATYLFEIPFMLPYFPLLVLYLSLSSLIIVIGLWNSRGILSKSPLEVLRQEA